MAGKAGQRSGKARWYEQEARWSHFIHTQEAWRGNRKWSQAVKSQSPPPVTHSFGKTSLSKGSITFPNGSTDLGPSVQT
ncbi:hypothetical protein I79_004733 [Cricetulus griseus]|uniref:Uncharacterized protein n=1 Tax=Cricetulus griseus TaxID=10029 RepID=G3H3B8_CRIGR|nr:hypothetical protein I79_004733 [Cricetulus griseus]